jgi:hypothetical protein
MSNRLALGVVMVALVLSVVACASQTPPAEETASTTPAAAESHEGHVMGKVSFAEPQDGAKLSSKSLTKFVFAAENYEIAAVPPGEVKEARANMGHFHLGVDSDCLAAGTVIPKAEAGATPGAAGSWIHFGTGSNNIEMSLTPGPHKFSVQVGDDLHRAVEGLCQTINVTVE